MFLIDYARRRRVKIWGTARVVKNDPELIRRLELDTYPAEAEQAVLFTVKAWDVNCTSHIPPRSRRGGRRHHQNASVADR
ncbi:hypothetical protein [Azospirillum sp. sgz301742]